MIVNAFALYDTKAGFFHMPFFFPHPGQAVRACIDLGQDMSTTIGRHPADYVLYQVGTYDDQRGVLEACAPVNMGVVQSFLPNQPPLPMHGETV